MVVLAALVLATIGLQLAGPRILGACIDGVDMTIHCGELVVITGRVGSGKTTLLRVLLGLLAAQRGHVFWNGKEVEAPSSYLRPPRIAYVPQVPRPFSMTLRDNILLGHPAGDAALP